jgi:hypothetical protein
LSTQLYKVMSLLYFNCEDSEPKSLRRVDYMEVTRDNKTAYRILVRISLGEMSTCNPGIDRYERVNE